jgi:hypothetical protein
MLNGKFEHLERLLKNVKSPVISHLAPGIPSGELKPIFNQFNIPLPENIQAIYQWHGGSKINLWIYGRRAGNIAF